MYTYMSRYYFRVTLKNTAEDLRTELELVRLKTITTLKRIVDSDIQVRLLDFCIVPILKLHFLAPREHSESTR